MQALKPDLRSKPRKYDGGAIEERMYVTAPISGAHGYKNDSGTLECFTILNGSLQMDGISCGVGMSVILEPGEIVDAFIETAMTARPKAIGANNR
jgi:mannose-6-phosphate isomerase